TEADRLEIGGKMDATDVAFFAVPLGIKVNPQNLHGFASLTGGLVVRIQENLSDQVKLREFITRLVTAINVPVLKVDKFKFGEEGAEVYRRRLPPLRADKSTLVMGKLAKPVGTVSLSVTGKVLNRDVTQNFSQALPAPQIDHYFMNLMLDQ